jgi:hypothetical protein
LSFFYKQAKFGLHYFEEKNQMKIKLTATALLLTLIICSVQAQKKEFAWLLGTWKLKDKNIFESWSLDKDGKTLNGVSMKVVGSESTILEETKLTFSGNSFFYIADVAGDQDPVDFRISSFDEDGFVAENPKHDFPKLIRYKLVKRDGKEFIEAAIEGNGKVIPYVFEKVR